MKKLFHHCLFYKNKIILVCLLACLCLLSGCLSLTVLGILASSSDLLKVQQQNQKKKTITQEYHRRYIQTKIEFEIRTIMPHFLEDNIVFYKKYKLYAASSISQEEKENLITVTKKFKKITLVLTDKKHLKDKK